MLCVGFLRGINVGGKNKVSMEELKEMYAALGASKVKTVGNTGRVVYDSSECLFEPYVEKRLHKTFNMKISYTAIPFAYYQKALEEAPEWWGKNEEWRHNVLFLTHNYPVDKALQEIGETDPEYERIYCKYGMIFWSSAFKDRKAYNKTQYSKLAKKECYQYFTIRNYNTALKVLEKSKKLHKELSR